ncbi:hypothetical protein dsat_1219 [Alkalidesulfovibrio alkalitolerans DSM 16529]|jgi:thioredoxin-like negative regulator of GroEL|uniref:Thioredoxin domain-containing protein n=1 Tax=Alkalidesulfovibrio alkalitolerans DSM 16529 TaxID=1121439 RepID=S7T088_9BACT|nr:thioredoxin family protein [Alkalidesulfovibrio alkalitolerans]EPR30497.1 hypothetical protein dsat_1219 [Alkalidesulfovibrio alkalitolerans DSM 16529]
MPDVLRGLDIGARSLGQATPVLVACLGSKAQAKAQLDAVGDVARRFGPSLQVYAVDEEELPGMRGRLGLHGTPTFLLFWGGRERDRFVGEAESMALERFVRHALGKDAS